MSITLFEACQKGLCHLIDKKYDTNQLDEQGRSALHYCCDNTNTACACVLLKNDLIKTNLLNLRDNEGCSALHLACMNGNEVMVKYLCEQGAKVDLVDNESHSLIHWITVCEHLHLFDTLLQYKAPIHTADIHGAFPIHYASQLCGVTVNDDLNIDPDKGLNILKILIDHKADIDCIDGQKRTPFMWAASAGAIEALRILYKYGANQLHIDKDSLTALHCSAMRGHASCIRMLVEQCGCPLEGEDINGCTALCYAVTLNHLDTCRVLLDLNANPNHQDNRGRTPVHCAILKGNIDCLKYLTKSYGDIWIKNKRGDYPVHEAINALSLSKSRDEGIEYSQLQTEVFAIIRYIFQLYPNKVNIQNDERRTPLHLAASLGEIDICGVLIECGARVNSFIRTTAGNYITPYDLARIRRQDACAEYLSSHHGGQRGNFLANILIRRLQKSFRQYKLRKTNKNDGKTTNIQPPIDSSIKSKNTLLKQAKLCLDNKKLDDRFKTHSLNIQTPRTNSPGPGEVNAEERRRFFAKSRSTLSTFNQSDDSKTDLSNKIIIHTSNSIATSNKLYDRRKLLAEELFKLKQARIHNSFIVINRALYKILIENAFNPQNRGPDEIEKYLETLLKAYDTELEAIRKRTRSVPPKQNRRSSQLF